MECLYLHETTTIMPYGGDCSCLYMLKKGQILSYSREYSYLCTYHPGAFFGEYNIMFGIQSQISYRTKITNNNATVMFKIDQDDLMNRIARDEAMFKHMFKISVRKFKFTQKLVKLSREFNGFGMRRVRGMFKLYNILVI